ncbi:coatomer protein gamma sub-unit [Cystoisospora suis]|uniref:Coatomer protein gamma sub-unit n=1 Tax=Cystoisospora suis TaxID=483139 RepID=A0A2C6KNH7_9APIC|nr:coatomer protein gamma sub-unit [Cystoisospora suis]
MLEGASPPYTPVCDSPFPSFFHIPSAGRRLLSFLGATRCDFLVVPLLAYLGLALPLVIFFLSPRPFSSVRYASSPCVCTSSEVLRFPPVDIGLCLLLSRPISMLSQFYVLSPRGDCLITKDYRNDAPKGAAEIFYRHVAFWQFPSSSSSADFSSTTGGSGIHKTMACSKGGLTSGGTLMMMNRGGGSGASEASPLFCVNGVTFAFLRRSGLYFVLTTQQNPSPALLFELLHRLTKIIQDFCGVLNEEAIRKNFVMIYELLDEIIDFGYPQLTSTESLKSSVYSEAVVVDPPPVTHQLASSLSTLTSLAPKTVPSNASHRPVGATAAEGLRSVGGLGVRGVRTAVGRQRRSEIFVDVLERLTVVLSSDGSVVNASLDGSIQMKSYLDGKYLLKLALNDDVVLVNQGAGKKESS